MSHFGTVSLLVAFQDSREYIARDLLVTRNRTVSKTVVMPEEERPRQCHRRDVGEGAEVHLGMLREQPSPASARSVFMIVFQCF